MRRLRLAALAAAAAALLAAPLWGPPLLRRAPGFEARRIEVTGTRLLAPHEAVAAAGIALGDNVWTDPAAWEAALRRHPLVADASVERRLPGTLRVRVREKRPAALVEAGALRPATATGELLPVDPTDVAVDLPLVRGAATPDERGTIREEGTRTLLEAAGRLAERDPALTARVSEVRPGPGGALLLRLGDAPVDAVVPPAAGPARLRRLRAALAEVERRVPADPSAERARIDLRFADQAVVRIPDSEPSASRPPL